MARLVLVASALLGPASWGLVPDALGLRGLEATLGTVTDLGEASGAVLVPHSNAGYWAPWLAEQSGAAAVVYVDAALPAYGARDTALAPPDFRDFLAGLADDDGLLPPWTRWWDDREVGVLFPDAATRRAVEAGEPRLPLTWFDQRVPVPHGWETRPSAYLGFGETYAEEQVSAAAYGWPVSRLAGGHLHHLHDPDAVAAAIIGLAQHVVGPTWTQGPT